MKDKIENVLNNIREQYLLMQVGRIPVDYEELLFQLEEQIRDIITKGEEQ